MGLQLWQICPADLRTSLPGAAACALVMGMSLGMLWPRLSRAILCDLLGLSLIVAVALPAIEARQPGRIASVLPGSLAQAVTLAALFAVGLGVQWWWIRRTTLPRARRNARNGRRAARHPLFPGAALPDHEVAEFFEDGADDAATPATAAVTAARGMQMPRMTPDVRMVA